MTQNQINREVAQVTGESISVIRSFGFNVVIVPKRWPKPRHDGGAQVTTKQSKPSLTQQQPKAA